MRFLTERAALLAALASLREEQAQGIEDAFRADVVERAIGLNETRLAQVEEEAARTRALIAQAKARLAAHDLP